MSISINGEILIELGNGTCFLTEGDYEGKKAFGIGRQGDDTPIVVITFKSPESVKQFVHDVTEMLKDTGA